MGWEEFAPLELTVLDILSQNRVHHLIKGDDQTDIERCRAWHCDVGDMGEAKVAALEEVILCVLRLHSTSEFLILFPVDGKELNILILPRICLPIGRVLVMYAASEIHILLY